MRLTITLCELYRLLGERKKALQRAIEGLGQHGMVGTSDERLMNLHDALKLEFQKVQRTYQDSLEKLDALALVVGKVGKGQVLLILLAAKAA